MDKRQIQEKIDELKSIMSQHKNELGKLEKEFFDVIGEYQKALEKEKIKEIKRNLNI